MCVWHVLVVRSVLKEVQEIFLNVLSVLQGESVILKVCTIFHKQSLAQMVQYVQLELE